MTAFIGQKVLITGAAKGIGRLMAFKIARKGGQVIVWDIDSEGLAELGAELDGAIATYVCDMSSRENIYQTAERTLADHGRVDILINNAGIVQGKPFLEADDALIQRTFDINVLAHFWTVRAFLPGMIARGRGHIVTIASAGGLTATVRQVDYSSSKFAAVGFDEALRLELKHHGQRIRTTAVLPYYINTGMFAGVQKTRFPWLLPIMEPDYVAERVVQAVEKNKQRVALPWTAGFLAHLGHLFPVPVYDFLIDFFGISRALDNFVGRRE